MSQNHLLGLSLLLVLSMTAHAGPAKFTLKSPTVQSKKQMSEDQVFNSFGCSGKNHSPALSWSNAPVGTKSFAVTVYDPDAPTGSGWWHWVVFNIPVDVSSLSAQAGDLNSTLLPKGAIQSRTDFDQMVYGGPCPPPGKPHRYYFRVYALKEMLPLDANSSAAKVGFYIHQNQLGMAEIMGTYKR